MQQIRDFREVSCYMRTMTRFASHSHPVSNRSMPQNPISIAVEQIVERVPDDQPELQNWFRGFSNTDEYIRQSVSDGALSEVQYRQFCKSIFGDMKQKLIELAGKRSAQDPNGWEQRAMTVLRKNQSAIFSDSPNCTEVNTLQCDPQSIAQSAEPSEAATIHLE